MKTFFTSTLRQGILLSLVLCVISANAMAKTSLENNAQVKSIINELVKKHGFDKLQLNRMFHKVKLQPSIIKAMNRPAEALPWHRYKQIFLKEPRIQQGAKFWQDNAETLLKAQQEYGVPSEIIVAILGVETRFGRNHGGYRVIDALTTLAVDYPKRSSFFRKELVKFLVLTRKEKIDAFSVTGSYAGAIGKPQFMPSSYLQYAVDFDHDGKRDLINSAPDAIGSVANYLSRHGWRRGESVATQVSVSGVKYSHLVDKGLKPHVMLSEIKSYGVSVGEDFRTDQKGALIELENKTGNEYWVGLNNFYAITRYNHSALYAMAVYQLAENIRDARSRLAAN